MKKILSMILMISLSLGLMTGCGQNTKALHCLTLGKEGTAYLFVDRDRGTVFTAQIPEAFENQSGEKPKTLETGDYVDIYGDGIMLESYPGQYPGVSRMVVTGRGDASEVAKYQDVIDQVISEPDISQAPAVSVRYMTSLGEVLSVITGPVSYSWRTASDDGTEKTESSDGGTIAEREDLENLALDEGKTDLVISSELEVQSVSAIFWPADVSETASDEEGLEALTEENANGEFVLKDVEPGYVYEVIINWEYGTATYGFQTSAIEK